MAVVVGVHGIGKQQLGRHQLLAPWSRALADGLERSHGAAVRDLDLDIAFYGDLVWPQPKAGVKGEVYDSDPLGHFDDEEVADLAASIADLLTDQDLADAEKELPSKGYTRAPGLLITVLAALDRKFGKAAAVMFVANLRQVRRYLSDLMIKRDVDTRVRQAVGRNCRVLIGHSLGSVVAFEFVRNNPDHHLDLLLTLGSPLGLRVVRDRLPHPDYGSGAISGVPANVACWVNVRDEHDPVACAGDLSTWWPGIVDRRVVNQGDAHSAERYLSKKATGQAILAAVPALAP